MPHQLTSTVRQSIGADAGWERNCTNTVVCWVWCVQHNHLQGGRAMPSQGGGFRPFLTQGLFPRSTPRFLKNMATSVGRRRWDWAPLSPWKGSLVLWVGATVNHASVNGGGNQLYGYNQNRYFSSCGHGFNAHCNHSVDDIEMAEGVHIYTVKPSTALTYFTDHENDYTKW